MLFPPARVITTFFFSPPPFLFHIWKHCITAQTPDRRRSCRSRSQCEGEGRASMKCTSVHSNSLVLYIIYSQSIWILRYKKVNLFFKSLACHSDVQAIPLFLILLGIFAQQVNLMIVSAARLITALKASL